ncbi:hypothetical protein MMC24_006060 [Lignoscripta atroalba]|nr:hypothetical protein [Lignoscripta atroalba]
MGHLQQTRIGAANSYPMTEMGSAESGLPQPAASQHDKHRRPPRYNHNGDLVAKGVHPDGESGRRGIHPWLFLKICFRSTCTASKWVNVLWPFVPAAIAIHFARPESSSWIFALNYIAMVPSANLLGFAAQEFARKLPRVFGVLIETFFGSIVEIVLFMVLLRSNGEDDRSIPIIQAAILGSILANLLLCLGSCFFLGGINRHEQEFDEAISEVGSGLLLVAAFGLSIPCAFSTAIGTSMEEALLQERVLRISRATALVLLSAFLVYVWFQVKSHHGIYDDVLEGDEAKDADRQKDLKKDKLTFTECIFALVVSLACVSLHAVFLVQQIETIVDHSGVSDMFMGLILVPLVEKFAEHLTAIDEAWDNQMNFALAHLLGSTVQTALLNSSLVVIVGWGLNKNMDLDFEIFPVILLILAVLVVGNFLRDRKSNYLEGFLLICVYCIIAVTTWYFPNTPHETGSSSHGEAQGHRIDVRAFGLHRGILSHKEYLH